MKLQIDVVNVVKNAVAIAKIASLCHDHEHH